MIGPLMKLIEKYRCLRLLRSSTENVEAPRPAWREVMVPPSSGISGSPRKQVNDPRFSFRENFLGLIAKESSGTYH